MTMKIIGWDQIYHLEFRNVHKPIDRIILLVHWNLIINNSFKCIGLGNEKYTTQLDKELLSELLPDGWNISSHYNIRYIYNDSLFILIGIEISNDLFLIHLLHPDSEILTSVILKISDTIISSPTGIKIPNLFYHHEVLLKQIQTDLVGMALKQSGTLEKQIPAHDIKKDNIRKRPISPIIHNWPLGNFRNIIHHDYITNSYNDFDLL